MKKLYHFGLAAWFAILFAAAAVFFNDWHPVTQSLATPTMTQPVFASDTEAIRSLKMEVADVREVNRDLMAQIATITEVTQ